MKEDRFEEALRGALEEHNAPPPAPRDAIWKTVERRRRGGRFQTSRWRGAVRPLLGVAAILALGVALGRWSLPGPPPRIEDSVPGTSTRTGVPGPETAKPAYRLAAARYLSRTETRLTEFRADPMVERREVAGWARDMLGELRLLLDSPAALDPDLRRLFLDLELVLVRMVHLDESDAERESIQSSIEARSLMLRIRNEIPAGI